MPASTSARTALITAASFLFGVCSSSTYRQRSIDRPEFTMVANWREKTVRSFGLTRPPIVIWPQPALTSLRSRTVSPLLRRAAATAALLSPSICPAACAPRASSALYAKFVIVSPTPLWRPVPRRSR